ncbi:MAG: hypothetical protein AAFY71_19400 [Bacteroidota bacterium]
MIHSSHIMFMGRLIILAGWIAFAIVACDSSENPIDDDDNSSFTYTGTASVSQGEGTVTNSNIYEAGSRVAPLGTIMDQDGESWEMPAAVNFTNSNFPFAPDLYNPDGISYVTASEAEAAYDVVDIVEIDADGEVITAYLFADNYFELYINGVPVGKDAIPFTQFNSHIVKFRVSNPYTIAMKLVDWEESIGVGTESAMGYNHHAGDGGVVAVFKDAEGNTVVTTDESWKAQTFYTAPIKDLSCVSENGTSRYSSNCDTSDENDASEFYALHWEVPAEWMNEDFDDSNWPDASTYSNEVIGVDNKASYTNYTDIFDNPTNDALFIWSTNVILDNEVIVRYKVE